MEHNWLRRNYGKIMLCLYIYMLLHDLITRFMFLMDSVKIKEGPIFFLSLSVAFLLIFVYIQKYWITACLLLFVNRLMNIALIRTLRTDETLINGDSNLAIWLTILGILCLSVSLIYFYKFIRQRNYADYYLLKEKNGSK